MRKRKALESQPAAVNSAQQQLLAWQLKVVELQEEGERERTAAAVQLSKVLQQCEERTLEQLKLL